MTRPHGTNTLGMERRGGARGVEVGTFGTGTRRLTPLAIKERGSWWADPKLQQNRTAFYDMAKLVQPDMNAAMLPLKTGDGFN
jgi:hypothetical protein